MRLGKRVEEAPKPSVRRCPSCGATASLSALQCTICGHSFVSSTEVSTLWGAAGAAAPPPAPPLLDLYADDGDGNGTILRAGGGAGAQPKVDLASDRRPPTAPIGDPWASSSGTLADSPGGLGSGVTAPMAPTTAATPREGGSRLRRALLLALVIVVAAGAAAWLVGRPYLTDQITDNVGGAIDDRLEGIAALPLDGDGRMAIVERDVHRAIRADAGAYEPVTAVRVSFSRNGVRIDFELYGAAHRLTGTLTVVDDRIVMVDPTLSGPAAALVDHAEIVASAEESVADMFARLGVRPVAVKTSDDTLTVTVE